MHIINVIFQESEQTVIVKYNNGIDSENASSDKILGIITLSSSPSVICEQIKLLISTSLDLGQKFPK